MEDHTPEKPRNSKPIIELPSWLLPALRSRRKWKTWLRCTLVLVATLVLMVDNVTLQSMGQAGFFAAILALMLPPSMPLSLFIFAALTLVLGMLLGWAWGAAAMAAALRARSQSLLASQLQSAQASLQPGVSPQLQFQQFIFKGRFLDARSSAVYGAFIFIGSFLLAAMRAAIPNLALLSIFGLIVLDVMCSYGPLFYSAQYTIAKQFLIPTAYYVGVAFASLVIIFPESMNHAWLSLFSDGFLTPTSLLLSLQTQALSTRPSERTTWETLTTKGVDLRRALVGGSQGLLGQIAMVDMEFSVGRLGPGDLKRLSGELKSLVFRTSGLLSFQNFVYESNKRDAKEEELEQSDSIPSSTNKEKDGTATPDRFTLLRKRIREREARHGHDLDTLIPILNSSSTELRGACDAALKGAVGWVQGCNGGRWRGFFFELISRKGSAEIEERQAKLVELLDRLETATNAFQKDDRLKLLEPFKKFFDSETGKLKEGTEHIPSSEKFTARSLFICFVFCDTLVTFAESLSKLLKVIIELDKKRPYVRFWAPSGFGKLGRKIMSKGYDVDNTVAPLAMGSAVDPAGYSSSEQSTIRGEDEVGEDKGLKDGEKKPQGRKEKANKATEEASASSPYSHHPRNPDALPPKTALGRFAVRLGSFFRWFKTAEGIFSLRTAVVTLALWIPAVCTSSAGFTYQHRGLWALIMAQTGLAVYAGDQIAGLFLRMLGTGVGLLLGMAVWYIGSGSGPGNPYGVVVATTVFASPFIFMRIAAPPQDIMIWIMTGVTIIFVAGYSWIDTHFVQLANAGIGVEVGWRRALLVIIGFAAGFIVMLFPRPTSARTLVRRTVAATLEELGRIFATEVEAILAEEARGRRGLLEKPIFMSEISDDDSDKVSLKERRVRRLAKKVLEVSTRLQQLAPSLTTGKWEPQLQGSWPQQHYQALYAAESRVLSSLVLLVSAFIRLDTKWCFILVHKTPFLNPHLLADLFSNVAVLSHALAGGHPVPASLPRLRDRLVYHDRHSFAHNHNRSEAANVVGTEVKKGLPNNSDPLLTELDPAPEKVDGVTIGLEELTLDVLSDDQLPAHSTAVIAISSILGLLDDIADTVRTLCGETSYEGISALHQVYLGREEEAILYRPRAQR